MNRIKSLIRVLSGRTVLRAVLALLLVAACSPLFAQRADVRSAGVYYVDGGANSTAVSTATGQNIKDDQALYCNWGTAPAVYASYSTNTAVTVNRSFVTAPAPGSNQNSKDPWVSSALIEYDQPYPATAVANNKYPNHCLALCMQVVCTNRPMAQATYSIAFPLQNITFDIVKYYNGKNIKDAEGTPAIRSIDLYPDINNNTAKCGSYRCPGGPNDGYTCTAPLYELR